MLVSCAVPVKAQVRAETASAMLAYEKCAATMAQHYAPGPDAADLIAKAATEAHRLSSVTDEGADGRGRASIDRKEVRDPVSGLAAVGHVTGASEFPDSQNGSALLKDQPLHDDACWFRTLTNEDHLARAETLHYQALKGTQFGPADASMPWDHELSGRALCLAGDASQIEADGRARIEAIKIKYAASGKALPSTIKFVAVASATAIEVRHNFGVVRSDTALRLLLVTTLTLIW
jgi:hypothetical protein